mgnify:CR=1 FL=1
MGLLDRIKQGAAKRKADKAKKNAKWDNPTQPAAKAPVKRNGSGPDKKGNDSYKPTNEPATKRTPQKTVSLEKKKPQKLETAELKDSKLKKNNQKPKETAAMFRARKAAELKTAKAKQLAKQKKVTLQKEADTYKPGKALGTPKKAKYSGVTSDDKKGQADVAASNNRATFNRTNKTKAKPGDTYKYKKPDGTTITIKKGGSTKHKGKGKQV